MSIFKTCRSNLRHVWAVYKEKKPDVTYLDRNIEVSRNSKLKLPKFKDLCIKSTKK